MDHVKKRIFVGGLTSSVQETELEERFSKFGKVSNMSLKRRMDESGNIVKSFCHLDLEGAEQSIKKCFNTYQNAKWKGSTLSLQFAKENFLERLQKEREGVDAIKAIPTTPAVQKPPSLSDVKTNAVPGTPVPGKQDWVVGKYGRVLPTMKLKKSYKLPIVKLDPSKHCHAAKVFKEEKNSAASADGTQINQLTWEIDAPDTEITRKRKGEFPHTVPKCTKTLEQNRSSRPPSVSSQALDSPGSKSLSQHNERTDFEVVKIGSVQAYNNSGMKKISNKFDSDYESDDDEMKEKTERNLKEDSPFIKKHNATNKTKSEQFTEQSSDLHTRMDDSHIKPEVKGPSPKKGNQNSTHQSVRTNESVSNGQSEGQGFNRKKIPEFKGLAMLGLSVQKNETRIERDKDVTKENDTKTNPDIKAKVSSQEKLPSSDFCSDNESVSSADTDEILLKHREKKLCNNSSTRNLVSSHLMSEPKISLERKTQTHLNCETKDNSGSESKFSLSEHTAATSNENIHDDSYDSDLDSNDFALVAKKLAKKAFLQGQYEKLSFGENIKGAKLKQTQTAQKSGQVYSQSSPERAETSNLHGRLLAIANQQLQTDAKESTQMSDQTSVKRSTDKDKKETDNEKRLQALKQKRKERQQQQNLVQNALKNVDTNQRKTNRIVFDSSDDDSKNTKEKSKEKMAEGKGEMTSPKDGCSSSNEQEEITSKKLNKFGLNILESSSDDDDADDKESNYDEMFKSKPQFEGKKGLKLFKLKQRIGDSRFELDEKFAESDSDDDSEREDGENDDDDEEEEKKGKKSKGKDSPKDANFSQRLEDEKFSSLQVLANVVGQNKLNLLNQRHQRITKQIVDMNAVRFDPTKIQATPATSKTNSKPQKNAPKAYEKESDELKLSNKSKVDKVEKYGSLAPSNTEELEEKTEEKKSENDERDEKKQMKMNKTEGNESEKPKSKVELDSTLLDLFKKNPTGKKEGASEEPDTSFSLLKQFDEDESEIGKFDAFPVLKFKKKSPDTTISYTIDKEKSSSDEGESGKEAQDEGESDYGERSDDDGTDADGGDDADNSLKRSKTYDISGLDSPRDLVGEEGEEVSDEENNETLEIDKSVLSITAAQEEGEEENEFVKAGRIDIRQTKEKWREAWNETRQSIIKMYKRKHRDALKRKRAQGETKRKREFLNRSKTGTPSKRRRITSLE